MKSTHDQRGLLRAARKRLRQCQLEHEANPSRASANAVANAQREWRALAHDMASKHAKWDDDD
jgi:hypothetical protein